MTAEATYLRQESATVEGKREKIQLVGLLAKRGSDWRSLFIVPLARLRLMMGALKKSPSLSSSTPRKVDKVPQEGHDSL